MQILNLKVVKKIAIIRRNGLGDVLCALPLVSYCKKRFPQAEITLFIDKRAEKLIPYLQGPDKVELFCFHKNKYISLLKTLFYYRKHEFDLAISTKALPMRLMNIFLFGLKASYKIAYTKNDWSSKLINCPQKYLPSSHHQALKGLRLLDSQLEHIPLSFYPQLLIPKKQIPLPSNSLFVSVSNRRIGSSIDIKKYASILEKLHQKKHFSLVINCEPQDEKKAKNLQTFLSFSSQVIVTPSFDDHLLLISSCTSLFIGDGGIMHLAAALNKPQVVLFGGTKVWQWHPLSSLAICLRDEHNVNCIPDATILEALEKTV